jgi:hypothetical protein
MQAGRTIDGWAYNRTAHLLRVYTMNSKVLYMPAQPATSAVVAEDYQRSNGYAILRLVSRMFYAITIGGFSSSNA